MLRYHFWIAALLALPASVRAAGRDGKIDYNFDVRPILSDRCFICHGPDDKARKAKLRLDVRDVAIEKGAIVPGKIDESEIVKRIVSADESERMPPAKSNLHLTKAEIDVLKRWVEQGAEYKPHWAFLPLPDQVAVPKVSERGSGWTNPIDQFVLQRLKQENLFPAPPAAAEDWLRRVTFDLTGLPPTIAELDEFRKAIAPKPREAYEAVVDRLLKSTRFGERMAQDWLDAARYADSFGYQADGDTNLWPWRDWVIRAFNENLSFDQFLTWQIAGDLLPNATRDQKLATAFNRLHRMTNEGGSIPEEWRNEYVADRVQTLATAVMGLTMECCRCHDHKYDPLTMRDYYGLGAFFNNIDEWGTYDSAAFKPTPTLLLPTPEQEKALADLRANVMRAERKLNALQESGPAAFRDWLKRDDVVADIPGLVAHYPLDKSLENRVSGGKSGSSSASNTFVAGKFGEALKFTGDDPAHFTGVLGNVERSQPFTASFWLWTPQVMKQGIVFHRQAGTDTGFHGVELAFDEGRLRFALVRFWPGNAAAIATTKSLPAKEWLHIAVSHDASGKAGGLRIYVNGKPADVEIVRDNLTKDLQAGAGHGGAPTGLTFGERFRSVGLKDCLLDEVRLFDRALSTIEVDHLFDGQALAAAIAKKNARVLRDYYISALHEESAKARAELRQVRQQYFATQTAINEIMTMQEMPTPRQAYVLKRGDYDAPKDQPVERQTPAALLPFPKDAPRNRLGLAQWLTHPNHPLTARVAANRTWQIFFGHGLVASQENFGTQGALPSHPELLDWLARDFIRSGWDLKALCKQIVLSETYCQRSGVPRDVRERDPENLIYARGPSRRLSAEMLRDAALFAGGFLAEKQGGPPVKPYQPPGMWRGMNAFLPDYVPDRGEGLYRRSLYTFWRRTSPPPNMLTFDAPSREICVVRRQPTSTPLQALVLLNDPQMIEAARGLGERMLKEGGKSPSERLAFAFRIVATRAPTNAELKLLLQLHERELLRFRSDAAGAAKYLKIGDRPAAKELDAAELAAASVVASTILNLDAAVMIR